MNSKIVTSEPPTHQYRHSTALLVVTSIATFISPVNSSAVNVALPVIGTEFAADAISLGWTSTAFLLATAVFLVPFGRLADIFGMKRMVLTGLALYVLSVIAAALSGSMIFLIVCRAVQGIASAMIFSTSTALLVLGTPVERRGHVLGINIATAYAGLSAGPFLGGLLTQTLGWRSIFWLVSILSVVSIVMMIWLVKAEWSPAKGEKFDLPGSIVYGFGLTAMIWGFSELPEWQGIASVSVSAVILAAFVLWELKVQHPVLNLRLFASSRVFSLSNLAALINYSATWGVAFLLSLYLQYIKGLSPMDAGIVILVMPIMQTVLSPLSGRLSDRMEVRWLVSAGMLLTMAGLIMFIFLDSGTGLPFIILTLVILGIGFAFFSSPNTNAIMSSVERKSLGIASATLATMRSIGQVLSMGIAMIIIAVVIGHVQITPGLYPQLLTCVRVAFTVFAVLCFGGIFASMARGNTR
jgi:EmrB/QacA subfamily drug resistance transporter